MAGSSSCSCSHWWHAPFYTVATVALLIAALSSSPSKQKTATGSHQPSHSVHLSLNASLALQRSGFHLTAAILQISPEPLLPPFPSTLFIVPDTAISNLSLHPSLAKQLFHRHTVPQRLTFQDLLKKPPGTCLPTLLLPKDLSLTRSNGRENSVLINGFPISHPDVFVHGSYVIHGVSALLHSIDGGGDVPVPAPACDSNRVIPWLLVVRILRSRGFISFSVGLNSVLDAVARDSAALGSVTLFAPRDSGFSYVASPAPLLEKVVRSHVVVGWYGHAELAAMHVGEGIRTLVRGKDLRISSGGVTGMVAVDGVEITEPDVYSEEGLVVHGISRALEMVQPSST